MICTFGDSTDVTWWRDLELPTRAIIGRDGRIVADAPWITSERGRENFAELTGLTVFSAQRRVVEMVAASGDLDGEPEKTTNRGNSTRTATSRRGSSPSASGN